MFFFNCTRTLAKTWRSHPFRIACLACVLLCFLMYNTPTPLMAQEQETAAPVQETASDTTAPVTQVEPERINIRIEFPIVEPLFDIFYGRDEPRIEADIITPIANPLQQLPPTTDVALEQEFRAKKLESPKILLDRLRE